MEQLGDPLLARFALLAGDGVSYHTDIAEPREHFISPADIDAFVAAIDAA